MILPRLRRVCRLVLLALAVTPTLPSQTLARPGWAGSGLTVTQWWRNSVIVEVSATPGGANLLQHTVAQLADLQTLGVDAILLRGIESTRPHSGSSREAPLASGFGTLDDVDTLMREASGRRIRLLVEVPASLGLDALAGDARFWLSRGVSGIYLGGTGAETQAKLHALRGALHGYVGDRILLGDRADGNSSEAAQNGAAPTPNRSRGDAPDIAIAYLRGFGSGSQPTDVAAVRTSLEAARKASAGITAAAVDPAAPAVTGDEAKARGAALLLARGSIALRAEDIGIGPEEQAKLQETQRQADEQHAIDSATSPAAAGNARRAAERRRAAAATAVELPGDATFVWYQRMIGLHRGNATMLGGEQTFWNHDAAGVIEATWRPRAGHALVALVNLSSKPAQYSLKDDLVRMQERGLFLRTVVRSDVGLGAMPLSGISLAPYGVYFGQLGR